MNSKPRKMNIHAGASPVDVDDLIAQAGAPSPAPPAKAAPATPAAEPVAKPEPAAKVAPQPAPPWSRADKRIRKTVLLYLTEREKMMLDYIRECSSVPSQRFLNKVLLPAIEAEAERMWNENSK